MQSAILHVLFTSVYIVPCPPLMTKALITMVPMVSEVGVGNEILVLRLPPSMLKLNVKKKITKVKWEIRKDIRKKCKK